MYMVATVILVALIALVAWIRLAPSDPGHWHVDPVTAPRPEGNGWLLRDDGGNAPAPFFAAPPEDVLRALDEIALAEPRTSALAGAPGEGRITWISRSAWMRYPDYTTAAALPVDGGTALVLYGRQRFGQRDLDVNRARVESWVGALRQRFGASA